MAARAPAPSTSKKAAGPAVGPGQVAKAWAGGKLPRVVLILGP